MSVDQSNEEIQKKYKQLKALQNSPRRTPVPDSQLWNRAEELVQSKRVLNDIDINSFFNKKKEKKDATELLKKYLEDYTIETIADKNTLCQLIYLEILQKRLQQSLNDTEKATNSIPSSIVDLIHKNVKEITSLKSNLGISRSQKSNKNEEKRDGFAYLQFLKRKYKHWLSQNQGSRTITCGHCGKALLLKIRTEMWDVQKHPFFKDRILSNEHIVKLYKEKRINQEDVSKIFEVSLDYVKWLCDRWSNDDEDKSNEKEELT